MSKETKILVITEGGHTEPKFFEQLITIYGVNAKIFSIEGNIYRLYKKMQEYHFLCDVKDALAEFDLKYTDKEILKDTFTYTYLVFDCDAHHTDIPDIDKPLETVMRENFERLHEMASYFVNETDPSVGKLYINYPMMESYKDCNAFFDEEYRYTTVDITNFKKYKQIVSRKKIANVRMDKYTRENFDDLTRMNVYKLNYIRRDIWDSVSYNTYMELADAVEIADTEAQYCDKYHQVQVLNTTLFMLIDYYGNREGFFDNLMKLSDSEHSDEITGLDIMTANPILLQKKYARIIKLFAEEEQISLDTALQFFYQSEVYTLLREGISDMHCRSDQYLAEELRMEYHKE